MSIFEIKGSAKKTVPCDIADIFISFKSTGKNAHEVSRKVMDECDSFLEEAAKTGIRPESIRYDKDNVEEAGYRDDGKIRAERTIRLRTAYDMRTINAIQTILQEGKYSYELGVGGDISNHKALRIELAKAALANSREEAEQLAAMLGISVTGVESVRRDGWGDELDDEPEEDMAEIVNGCVMRKGAVIDRSSDRIGVKEIEESVDLRVKWILE